MTDPPFASATHTATAVQPKVDSTQSPRRPSPSLASTYSPADDAEEDDSTIKCICGYKHDDGSSVFCEKCETWQHTECYYYDEKNDRLLPKQELDAISHFCMDCEPRQIDVQAAINRQRTRFPEFEDKKSRKTPSRSHKKKIKPIDSTAADTNGWPNSDANGSSDRPGRNPRENLSSSNKRPKTNHRSSNSTNLPQAAHIPTSHPHKRSGSTVHSPSKPLHKLQATSFVKERYSDTFLQLYDEDPGEQSMRTNIFIDIKITRDLSSWAYDPEALKEATRGFSHADVFHRIEQPLSDIMGPLPHKQQKEDSRVIRNGRHPRWIFLTSDVFTKQNSIIGELKGKIGHMTEYIAEPSNRWDWLRHPAPFVFFHPKLPIYIDTRSEGSICRYLRRSCRPNLSMTTFLENDSEYHFCFTAKEDIDTGTEFTIGWVLDEHMRKFSSNKNDMTQDLGPDGEEYFTDWVGKVSAEFGGCACGRPESCWLVRYDPENKAALRGKGSHNRRRQRQAAQEASDAEDGRSTSRSKSRSRDMTPVGMPTQESGALPGLEISDREKRKIAALEKNFEQLENDKHQPATKKKKRSSGGNNPTPGNSGASKPMRTNTTSSSSVPNTPGLSMRAFSTEAEVPRGKSGSPSNGLTAELARAASAKPAIFHTSLPARGSPSAHLDYVSVGIQTDLEDANDWYKPASETLRPRKPFLSLTKRLLLRSQHDRQKLDEKRRSLEASRMVNTEQQNDSALMQKLSPVPKNADSGRARFDDNTACSGEPKTLNAPLSNPAQQSEATVAPAEETKPVLTSPREEPVLVNGTSKTNLHVQMPSNPLAIQDPTSNTPVTATPTSMLPQSPFSQPSNLQPPFTGAVNPSPAKKKVSLSDYIKRKGSHPTDMKASDVPKAPTSSANGALPEESAVSPPLTNREDVDTVSGGSNLPVKSALPLAGSSVTPESVKNDS